MIVLAFDLATKCGVALGPSSGNPTAWTETLGEQGEPHSYRFSQVMELTNHLIRKHKPNLIAIEQPIASGPKGGQARGFLAMGLRGCVLGTARLRGVRVCEFPVQTLRKHFIGHGNMPTDKAKRMTIDRCRSMGWVVEDDNAADACAVWDLACATYAKGYAAKPLGGLF